MASSNPIFKEEDLAALEEVTEKAAALAKAARRAMNLNILIKKIKRVKNYDVLVESILSVSRGLLILSVQVDVFFVW